MGGAGRTDAGVHALAQVAHLRARKPLPDKDLAFGLNDRLPFDVNVLEVSPAPPRFHARHDALSRTYLYRISRRRTAFDKRFVWWVKDRLDFSAMSRAAGLFAGRHDYSSFCENASGQESTIVVVEKSDVLDWQHEIHYRVISASHFLWKMVRRLIGTLVEVGRGNLDDASVEAPQSGRATPPSGPPRRRASSWRRSRTRPGSGLENLSAGRAATARAAACSAVRVVPGEGHDELGSADHTVRLGRKLFLEAFVTEYPRQMENAQNETRTAARKSRGSCRETILP